MSKKLFDFSWQYISHVIANIFLLYVIMELTTKVFMLDIFKWTLIPMLIYFSVSLFISDSIVHGIWRLLFHWED